MNCHDPLKRDFWLGRFDPRPLALFRILLGLTVLHDLADFTRDFRAFATDDGFLPRSVPRAWWAWSLFDLAGSPAAVAVLYAIGVVAFVAFTVGYRTRIATIVCWGWLLSLHHRNEFVTDGGDNLVAILLFWSIFADLGGAYGVDAARRPRASVPVFGLRLLQAHIAVLYYAAARLKAIRGWLRGAGIFQSLQLVGFVRPLGALLLRFPRLCRLLTYAVLVMEGAFPVAAFLPFWILPARAVAFALGVAIQVGIASVMRAGIFQEAMLSTCALFVLPEWIDAVEQALRARGWNTRWMRLAEGAVPTPPASRGEKILAGVLAVQFAFASWGFFLARRFPLPRVVGDELALLSLEQPADLFGSTYLIPRWDAYGRLDDGSEVEVLGVVAPGAHDRESAVRFSRWNKFLYKQNIPWPTLGPYLCRAYDERRPGPKLVSLEVVDHSSAPRVPDDPPGPVDDRVLWTQQCP